MDRRQTKHALTVLTRLAQRDPSREPLLLQALQALSDHGRLLAAQVFRETGEPMGSALASALAARPSRFLANQLRGYFDRPAPGTWHLRAEIATQLLELPHDPHEPVLPQGFLRPEDHSYEEFDLLLYRADALLDGRRVREALAATDRASALIDSLDPTVHEAARDKLNATLAQCYAELGENEGALRYARQAAARSPDAGDLVNLANRLMDEDPEQALTLLHNAEARYREMLADTEPRVASDIENDTLVLDWRLSPNFTWLRHHLALTLMAMFKPLVYGLDRLEDARAAMQAAVGIFDDLSDEASDSYAHHHAVAQSRLAYTLVLLGRAQEAVDVAVQGRDSLRRLSERSGNIHPDEFALSLAIAGEAHADAGEFDAALDDLTELQRVVAEHPELEDRYGASYTAPRINRIRAAAQ
jgi:tetratricopeptide (TPR) repeat protein